MLEGKGSRTRCTTLRMHGSVQVSAGEFLQQFFNPYYSAPPPPAPPAPADSFVNPLGGSLLPPGASSLGQLVRQIVAFQAQPPASASLLSLQQPAGAPSPLLSPVSAPVLAPRAPTPEVSDALPPAQPPAAESQPPVTQPSVTQPLATAAHGPQVSADAAAIPLALSPMPHLGALPPVPQLGAFADALPGAPGAGAAVGQAGLLPASLSALATAAVLAEQVRPQVNDLAGLISNETSTAISDSPIGGLLRNGPLLPVVATPPPPATLDGLILNLLTSSSPPAPPPFPVDLPAALGSVGSLVNDTVTGLTDNVR